MRDLDDILGAEQLELPIRGKTYRIPPMGYQDGLRIKAATEPAEDDAEPSEVLSDEELLRICLGDALDEMRADNLSPGWILRAALTARADAVAGRKVAEMVWENGPDPEALAAQVAALVDSTTSPATDAAGSSTKRPASTSGTRTPRKAQTTDSAGRKSSTRGR